MQNFKREEQNFVVQNEINNLSFLTGDSKTKMSKVGAMSKQNINHHMITVCYIILYDGIIWWQYVI